MNSNEYNILSLLHGEINPLFFREIAKKSKTSIGGTQSVLRDYSKFLTKEVNGRNTYFSLKRNVSTSYLRKIIELEKTIRFLEKNKNLNEFIINLLKEKVPCLIFGSYARGSNSKDSDLDLLILSNKKVSDHLCPVKLQIINLSLSEFKKLIQSQDAFGKEIIKSHIILNNFDEFMGVFNNGEN